MPGHLCGCLDTCVGPGRSSKPVAFSTSIFTVKATMVIVSVTFELPHNPMYKIVTAHVAA